MQILQKKIQLCKDIINLKNIYALIMLFIFTITVTVYH